MKLPRNPQPVSFSFFVRFVLVLITYPLISSELTSPTGVTTHATITWQHSFAKMFLFDGSFITRNRCELSFVLFCDICIYVYILHTQPMALHSASGCTCVSLKYIAHSCQCSLRRNKKLFRFYPGARYWVKLPNVSLHSLTPAPSAVIPRCSFFGALNNSFPYDATLFPLVPETKKHCVCLFRAHVVCTSPYKAVATATAATASCSLPDSGSSSTLWPWRSGCSSGWAELTRLQAPAGRVAWMDTQTRC